MIGLYKFNSYYLPRILLGRLAIKIYGWQYVDNHEHISYISLLQLGASTMCGRYALMDKKSMYKSYPTFEPIKEVDEPFVSLPRYNASPMQKMPVIAVRDQELRAQPMQWWLIPHWSKDGKPSFSTFNAKRETLEESRVFSPYYKGSRCLVPADAFYEWKKIPITKELKGGKSKEVVEKQPMCIRMKDEKPFMFAGLFSVWKNAKEEEFPSFTIITTEPNKLMEPIHNRMPVILQEKDFEQWLDRDFKETSVLNKLLVPFPASKMEVYPVSKMVSNSRNDSPECIEPIKEENL